MRVYISGKIGEEVISDATRQKFAKAEEMLRAKGYEVFNPCGFEWQGALHMNWKVAETTVGVGGVIDRYGYYLLKDIQKLAVCDAVYFLEDWRKSPGATSEYFFAKATGKRMFFQDRHEACEYLVRRMYKEKKDGILPAIYLKIPRADAEIEYGRKHLDEAWLPIEGKEAAP